MKTVLVTIPVKGRHREKLEAAGAGCRFIFTDGAAPTAEQIAEAEIIIGLPPAGLIQASEKLEYLHLSSAGADAFVKPGVLAKKTLLTNSTGAYSKAVSEHAFAMTLMLQKKLHLYRDAQRQNRWSDEGTVTSIADATVLVVGLGDIGMHYARMAKALGATVIGVRRRGGACPEGIDELVSTDALDTVLPRADVIFSILPATPATAYLYTAERFKAMKNTAIFINCGRGNAVSAQVLYDALTRGEIAAAGIDVMEVEPLPADSPLWQLDNLLITPHASGFFHLPETYERVVDIACHNLSAYLSGGELMNPVDFATGYKKSER